MGWFLGGVWKVASVSEVSGDWEDAFIITSESDSESESWGNSGCFSAPEKSGGSGLLASFHGWTGHGVVFNVVFIYVTSFGKSNKEFWRF